MDSVLFQVASQNLFNSSQEEMNSQSDGTKLVLSDKVFSSLLSFFFILEKAKETVSRERVMVEEIQAKNGAGFPELSLSAR